MMFAGVPLSRPVRSTLRLWAMGAVPSGIVVRAADAEMYYMPDSHGALIIPDLARDLGISAARADVTIDAGDTPVWGLVSATDPRTPMPTLYFPR